jgi:hypothetical protein
MKSASDFILEEMGGVEEVVEAARSIEATRRGASVDPSDVSVQVLAAEIILSGAGAEIRRQCSKDSASSAE